MTRLLCVVAVLAAATGWAVQRDLRRAVAERQVRLLQRRFRDTSGGMARVREVMQQFRVAFADVVVRQSWPLQTAEPEEAHRWYSRRDPRPCGCPGCRQ